MCEIICDSPQALCIISSQSNTSYGGTFSWPQGPGVDTEIRKTWTAAAWATLKSMVQACLDAGGMCNSQGEEGWQNKIDTVSPEDPITADIYNHAAQTLSQFGVSVPSVGKDTVIWAYNATNLSNSYNGGNISSIACDECNIECDACDDCDCDT